MRQLRKIKPEPVAAVVKEEAVFRESRFLVAPSVQTQTITDHGREVIEILDSESEEEPDISLPAPHSRTTKLKSESLAQVAQPNPGSGVKSSTDISLPFDPATFTTESTTVWTDSDLISHAIEKRFKVTKELQVDRVEYLNEIPSVWPVLKEATAFIVDLRDPKFAVFKDGETVPVTPDFLIKNKVRVLAKKSTVVNHDYRTRIRGKVEREPQIPPL